MDKKTAGLLGAMSAFVAATPGMAAPGTATPANADQSLHAASYADLLRPIPNASATLQAMDREDGEAPASVVLVQYHHHHRYHRRYRRHHHHHSMVIVPDAAKPA